MMKVHTARMLAAGLAAAFLLSSGSAYAEVIGYWRMEADADTSSAYSVANEVTGSALTGSAGGLGTEVPIDPVTLTMATNTASLDGAAEINGTVAYYSALDSGSITVEFFTRSNEGDARLILRETGGEGSSGVGLRIDNPNNLRFEYSVDDGAGGSTRVIFSSGINLDSDWDHVAFTYDALTGVGSAYLNGVLMASNDGDDNRDLVWPTSANLLVGNGMDGGPGLSTTSLGFFDELRITNGALMPSGFLTAPEPSSLAMLVGLSVAGLAVWRRRRRS